MAQILEDGSVIPSYLGASQGAGMSAQDIAQNDLRLRVGRVVAVHAPDSKTNANGKFFEYDVEVDIGAGLTKVYPRAVMMDTMGGMADFFEWTPRISQGGSGQIDQGTRVLVLCVNGQSGRAVIIGGAKHHGRKQKESREKGHHMEWEFNGINATINKDGDLLITHKGATNADGSIKSDDEKTNGTSILLNKDGDVKIGTGKNSTNLIHLDSKNKKILIDSTEDLVEVHAKGNIKMLSSGVLIGDATDKMLLGESFRNALSSMNDTLKQKLQSLSLKVSIAGAALTTGGTSMSVPITGAVAAGPQINSAGQQLTQAGQDITACLQAIQQFEQKSYLSDKNKSD